MTPRWSWPGLVVFIVGFARIMPAGSVMAVAASVAGVRRGITMPNARSTAVPKIESWRHVLRVTSFLVRHLFSLPTIPCG
jgi:hypothetical protein